MKEIQCPHDLNQFLFKEPIFENSFPEEECEQRKFYGDCHHCFSTAIAKRDRQVENNIIKNINAMISKWWTDNISYEYMVKISEMLTKRSNEERICTKAQLK